MTLQVYCFLYALKISVAFAMSSNQMQVPTNSLMDMELAPILDKLSIQDAIYLGQTSKKFQPILRQHFAKYTQLAKDDPDCIFGGLAIISDPDMEYFKKVFEFYATTKSKEWVSAKFNEPCKRFGGATPLNLTYEYDNGLMFKYAADMGAFVGHEKTIAMFYKALDEGVTPKKPKIAHVLKLANELKKFLYNRGLVLEIMRDFRYDALSTANMPAYFLLRTPLYELAKFGSVEPMRILLENGADPNIPDVFNELPIVAAAGNGDLEKVRLLAQYGSKLENKDYSALHIALNEGHSEVALELVNLGADVNWKRFNFGKSVFHNAVQRNNVDVVQAMLERGADLNAMWYPLKFSALFGLRPIDLTKDPAMKRVLRDASIRLRRQKYKDLGRRVMARFFTTKQDD